MGHIHYFNDRNIHLFPEGFAFVSCKYLHFLCFVENLRTKQMKNPGGNKWIFLHKKTLSFEWEWLFNYPLLISERIFKTFLKLFYY